MQRIRTALATAALLTAGTAQAQQAPAPVVPTRVTAGTLTNLCAQDRSACLTYILGATDALASSLVAAGRPQVFCIPAGTNNEQVSDAVQNYVRAHPEEAGSNAALVILAGLVSAYPCG